MSPKRSDVNARYNDKYFLVWNRKIFLLVDM